MKVADPTSDNSEDKWQQEVMLHLGRNIHMLDESNSEPENDLPTFFIHEVNGCLSLLASDDESYMFDMDEFLRVYLFERSRGYIYGCRQH